MKKTKLTYVMRLARPLCILPFLACTTQVSYAGAGESFLEGFSGAMAKHFEQVAEEQRILEAQKKLLDYQYKLEAERQERQMRLEAEQRESSRRAEAARLEEQRRQQRIAEEKKVQDEATQRRNATVTGTGFFITSNGYLVTNHHVVEDKTHYAVRDQQGSFYRAEVVAQDANRDLAILRVAGKFPSLRITRSESVTKGQRVMTVGYPQVSIQGNESKVTDGVISSFSGMNNDANWFQISTPIQGGNSGGPLVTETGQVVGVVVATANAMRFFKNTGNIPQNVNYAIKSNVLLGFLTEQNITNTPTSAIKATMEAVDRATVLVIAKNSPIDVSYVVSPQQRAEQERERSIALVEESKRQKLRAEADRKAEALAKADEVRAKKEQQASEKRAREDAARKELRDREVSKSVANWKELVEDEMFSAWLKAQSSDMQSKFDSAKAVEVVSVFKRFQVERKEFSESYFRPGRVIKDCNDCPEMVIIPAGGFQMGSNSGGAEERPTHSVFVNSFAIGKYEVTQGQWNSVMGSNPSHFKDCGDTCPVEQVNWDDAQAFIQKLNQKSGRIYRLPSESEWEYACRAGATHTYCGSNVVDSVAVYDTNSGKKTQTVGSKQPNAWAIYDMSGNVWEWTQDCWNVNYKDAPKDGSVWARGDCSRHVLRGGSSYFIAGYSRAGFRDGYTSVGRNLTGFRVAKTLP